MEHAAKHLLWGTEDEQGQGWCHGTARWHCHTEKHPQQRQTFPALLHVGIPEAALLPAGHGQHGEGQPWGGSTPRAHIGVQITAALANPSLKIFTDDSSFGCEPNLIPQVPPNV